MTASDTVIIVTDVLAEVFGYDKYSELTAEFAISGTYCDLAKNGWVCPGIGRSEGHRQ
jgi:hypothetical protein